MSLSRPFPALPLLRQSRLLVEQRRMSFPALLIPLCWCGGAAAVLGML